MDFFDNLASFGLTIAVLQVIILATIGVFILGLYWRYIVAGIGIMFCVVVFAMPSKKVEKPIETMTPSAVKEETVTKSLKPDEQVAEVKPEPVPEVKLEPTEKDMFMEDCQKYGGYTASQCVALWNDRENDKVRFRRATNKMFMMKVKHYY